MQSQVKAPCDSKDSKPQGVRSHRKPTGPPLVARGDVRPAAPQLRHHLRRQSVGASRPGASRHAFIYTPPPLPDAKDIPCRQPPSTLSPTLALNARYE
ncbi:hypothetical protein CDAR_411011 [Caerostris darwini]|uniref:Uncharacterized protein n=1 Tax=Caerostris darwini TaxID=1538125 RepID=A0AAV4SG67_9ARAC|nr:hypothetical protein CDAR_411011 [Caerostris darwini]